MVYKFFSDSKMSKVTKALSGLFGSRSDKNARTSASASSSSGLPMSIDQPAGSIGSVTSLSTAELYSKYEKVTYLIKKT